MIQLDPDNIDLFPAFDTDVFCLIVPMVLNGVVTVSPSTLYSHIYIRYLTPENPLNTILTDPELVNADIVFIPYKIMDNTKHAPNVLPTQRVLRFACSKTPIDVPELAKLLNLLSSTNSKSHEHTATLFIENIIECERIVFYDKSYNVELSLEPTLEIVLTKIYGTIKLGSFSGFPAGEIALTHRDFHHPDICPIKKLNGTLCFHGMPIVHRNVSSEVFSDKEQARLFSALRCLKEGAVMATVVEGVITELESVDNVTQPAVEALHALFTIDSRFRTISEIGFGLDSSITLEDKNTIRNERFGGDNICVHYGLGGHQTILHLDIVVPTTQVVAVTANGGQTILTAPQ